MHVAGTDAFNSRNRAQQLLLNGNMLSVQQYLGCSVSAAVPRGRAGVLLWGTCVTALRPMEYSASSAASTAALAAATLLTASAMHKTAAQHLHWKIHVAFEATQVAAAPRALSVWYMTGTKHSSTRYQGSD